MQFFFGLWSITSHFQYASSLDFTWMVIFNFEDISANSWKYEINVHQLPNLFIINILMESIISVARTGTIQRQEIAKDKPNLSRDQSIHLIIQENPLWGVYYIPWERRSTCWTLHCSHNLEKMVILPSMPAKTTHFWTVVIGVYLVSLMLGMKSCMQCCSPIRLSFDKLRRMEYGP